MKAFKSLVILAMPAIAALAMPTAAEAAAAISFINPDKFADASPRGFRSSRDRDAALNRLRQHLERLSARYLQPGQTLNIEILNLDLAGSVAAWPIGSSDSRLLSAGDPPSIEVRYTLSDGGVVVLGDRETIRDPSYLKRTSAAHNSPDPLAYEKVMLTNWFRARFAAFGIAGR